MTCEVYSNVSFIGEFKLFKILGSENILSTGSIIELDKVTYCIGGVYVRRDGTLVFEVS